MGELFEFGTSKVIESKAGHLLASDDKQGLNRIFNSSFFFQLVVGILVIPLFFLAVYFGLRENSIRNQNFIILLFSFSAGLSVFKSLFSSVIIASRKIYLDNSIQILINLINYSLVLLLTPMLGGVGLAIITLSVSLMVLVRSKRRVHLLFPFLGISKNNFDYRELKSLLSNGIYFSLGSVATILITKIDSFILGKYVGLEVVASYFISIKLFILVQKMVQILYNNYRPYISFFYGKSDFDSIKLFYTTTSWFLYGISITLIAMAMMFNSYFVTLWVGKEYLLQQKFIILFGIFILLDLFTLPSRVVLVSTLYDIKHQSFSRIAEGCSRLLIISLLLNSISFLSLPLSSVISIFVFGNVFFHFQLSRFFKTNNVIIKNIFFYIVILILFITSLFIIFNLETYLSYFLLLVGIVVLVISYMFERLNYIHLKQLFILK
jgi:O-antigen/teichoic acid export membrane protein